MVNGTLFPVNLTQAFMNTERIAYSGSAPNSSLRISAFLCASAVTAFTEIFTAEAQRNAEKFQSGRYSNSSLDLPRGGYKKAVTLSSYVIKAGLSKQPANPPGRLKRFVVILPERQVKLFAH